MVDWKKVKEIYHVAPLLSSKYMAIQHFCNHDLRPFNDNGN